MFAFFVSSNHPNTWQVDFETSSTYANCDDIKPLKRAHFILFKLVAGYHISSINPPLTPALKDENREIEEREAERWRRVVRGNSIGPNETEDWWNLDKVESFYRKCCSSRAEESDPAISAAFKRPSGTNPRSVDLSGVQLTPTFAAILSDVFMIEWGLRKECVELKIVLHALLILGTLVFLSVASNRRLKTPAFEVPGFPRCLDLSQRNPDKKAVDYTAVSLTTVPEPGLTSLHLDYCSLRVPALDVAINVRTSSNFDQVWQPELFVIRPFATSLLRHKRINATGAVALALMIRDHPDVVPTTPNSSTFPSQGSIISSPPSSPIPPFAHPPPPSSVTRTGPVLPPPRLLSTMPPQTTYAPHVFAEVLQQHNLPRSRLLGDVTTRHLAPNTVPQRSKGGLHPNGTAHRHDDRPSAALPDEVRALDALPRLGALRTLDLRGNDLRYSKKQDTRGPELEREQAGCSVLDGKCRGAGNHQNLIGHISRNPYSGPGLEGSQPLRTAFTLNNALKGPFLSSTNTTSPGAIALAEFLPGSISLLHLDLTDNNLDIAAVMALSSGLKANHTMGCLDVNIPRDDEEFAECLVICTSAYAAVLNRELGEYPKVYFSHIFRRILPNPCITRGPSPRSASQEELLDLSDKLNSAIAQLSSAPSSRSLHHVSEDDTPLTPKVYKGKGRAEPEPGKVLSTTFMMTEDEVEDDNILLCEEDRISVPSPVVRSKSWVEEEGEIFRKGAVLLGPEEMEGECAGADLRRELLEAMVERPPRRVIDELAWTWT
ncbi:hypothetical protein F4604DRAFT_1970279 [Suillus subluteus]|nr:hypothetical protein F4604DRAFT_1970279 [Suillus subluteus]